MNQTMYSFIETTARQAGDTLLHYFRKANLSVEAKGVGDLVTEADRASERILIAAIRQRFPDHGILSEEAGRLPGASRYVWLLDPLEATYNYSRGLPIWGINMALTLDDEVVLGAFFDPLLEEFYYAEHIVLLEGTVRVAVLMRDDKAEPGSGVPFAGRSREYAVVSKADARTAVPTVGKEVASHPATHWRQYLCHPAQSFTGHPRRVLFQELLEELIPMRRCFQSGCCRADRPPYEDRHQRLTSESPLELLDSVGELRIVETDELGNVIDDAKSGSHAGSGYFPLAMVKGAAPMGRER